MVDEIYDRHYQAARIELNASLAGAFGRFGNAVAKSLQALHRIEWSAPWNPQAKGPQVH